jgi:uridine kinase
MPGAEPTLSRLRKAGLAIGVASNCSQRYLRHMLEGAGLARWVDEARCLDSAGVSSKADMIAGLLERFATRSALMVGDRSSDRDAAWQNGIPHVHCAFGFAAREEEVEAEARIEDLGDLPAVLDARRLWVEAALERSGILRASAPGPRTLGVTGPPAVGKSLFARDAARILSAWGQPAVVVPLAVFAREGQEPPADCDDCLGAAYDLASLDERLLEPHARGEVVRPAAEPTLQVAPEDLLILEGPFLLDPRLSSRLDRIVHLEAPEALLLRRIAGRDARGGTGPLVGARGSELPLHREHALRFPPERLADAVIDASNALGSGFACRTG